MILPGRCALGRRPTGKVAFSSSRSTKGRCYQHDLSGFGPYPFLHHKVPTPLAFHAVFLGIRLLCTVRTEGRGVLFPSQGWSIYINYVEFCCTGGQPFLCTLSYLSTNQYEHMGIYFILWVITQYNLTPPQIVAPLVIGSSFRLAAQIS